MCDCGTCGTRRGYSGAVFGWSLVGLGMLGAGIAYAVQRQSWLPLVISGVALNVLVWGSLALAIRRGLGSGRRAVSPPVAPATVRMLRPQVRALPPETTVPLWRELPAGQRKEEVRR